MQADELSFLGDWGTLGIQAEGQQLFSLMSLFIYKSPVLGFYTLKKLGAQGRQLSIPNYIRVAMSLFS